MRHWHHASVLPMTKGWDEIKAAVDTVVLDVLAVQAALISKVLLKLLVDVVSDWLPAKKEKNVQWLRQWHAIAHPKDEACFADITCTIQCCSQHHQILECPRWWVWVWRLSLLYPPCVWWFLLFVWFALQTGQAPKLCIILQSTQTHLGSKGVAFLPSALSSFLSLYRSVRKRLLTRVDFPRPDSPSEKQQKRELWQNSTRSYVLSRSDCTCNHERKVKSLLDWLPVHLVWERRKTHIFLVLVLQEKQRWNWTCLKVVSQSLSAQRSKVTMVIKVLSTEHTLSQSICCFQRLKRNPTPLRQHFLNHRTTHSPGSWVTSLLLYGSNRLQGLLGLAGDGKSNSTLLLCGKLWSDPESESAQSPEGGCKHSGGYSRSLPSPSAWHGSWCSGCPPCWGGSCIMFSTSESSDWLKCYKRCRGWGASMRQR